jgi:hypothetical protein
VMFRQFVAIALIALFAANASAICPAVFRLVNAVTPNTAALDLLLNNRVVANNVQYKTVSNYFSILPGVITVSVRATGTGTILSTRQVQAVPGGAYTVAPTGTRVTGPTGQLLFTNTPYIYQEDLMNPTPGTFRGVFHRLNEDDNDIIFQINQGTIFSGVYEVSPKTSTPYPEQLAGSTTFATYNLTNAASSGVAGVPLTNSLGQNIQLTTTVTSNIIYDLFAIGDDQSNNLPTTLVAKSSVVTFDSNSGCVLVDGSTVFSTTTFIPITSFTPVFCSASTIASGLALLLALVALFF